MVQASLTMFLALFVAPYGFSVDMVGYSIALAVLAQRRGWRVTLLDGLFWLWPGYAALITGLTGVLLTPLVIAAALLVGWVSAPGRGAGAGG
jgi:thiamine transporter ThiT